MLQIDRADILNHLIRHQEQEYTWKTRFLRFHRLLRTYQDYIAVDDKEAFFSGFAGAFAKIELKEHLNAEEPWLSILEEHRPPEDDGLC